MSRINEIINEAHERLKAAQLGLQMILDARGEGQTGLRNVAVFGRMVTFATNNLRSVCDGFEAWDIEAKKRHFDNTTCRYMTELRNVIEKQARTPTAVGTRIHSYKTGDLDKVERPPVATTFFMGDRTGGNGWIVKDSDGREGRFYVNLPQEIGETQLLLSEHNDANAAEVGKKYVASLEAYLRDVKTFVCWTEA